MTVRTSLSTGQLPLSGVESVPKRITVKRARRSGRRPSHRAKKGTASPEKSSNGVSGAALHRDPALKNNEFSSDPITLYLNDVSNISLLSKKREVFLAKQIEAGELALKKLQQDDLSAAEILDCEALVAQGNKARAELIEANYRLVISITKRYMSQGVSFLDLVQEGNLGLIKAVEKFD